MPQLYGVAKTFARNVIAAINSTKYLYIRAGAEHRFLPIWAVVVDGRVLVRPWNDKPGGWYRAFLKEPTGAMRVNEREIPVRARRARSARLIDAMDDAYAAKYTTKANQPYVKAFRTAKRKATTTELVPR